jgi:hypothetical protein
MEASKQTIAKALEIAIALTKADHTWLRMDERGYIFVKDPLFRTTQIVIRLIESDIANLSGEIRTFSESESANGP